MHQSNKAQPSASRQWRWVTRIDSAFRPPAATGTSASGLISPPIPTASAAPPKPSATVASIRLSGAPPPLTLRQITTQIGVVKNPAAAWPNGSTGSTAK